MYTRPVVYKIFSIFMLVAGALMLTGGIIALFSLGSSNDGIREITKDMDAADSLSAGIIGGIVAFFNVSVLVYFLEFVYFASFSRFVNHMKNDNNSPLPKRTTLIPTSLMRVVGIILFVIQMGPLVYNSVLFTIILLLKLFDGSLSGFYFVFLISLTFLVCGLFFAFYFVHYILRFSAFNATVAVAEKTKASDAEIMRLVKFNTNIPRGMCMLLWYITIGVFILPIAVLIVLIFIKEEALAGQFLARTYIWFPSLIAFGMVAGVYSCMYDNLAMAMEHEKIKYRLF